MIRVPGIRNRVPYSPRHFRVMYMYFASANNLATKTCYHRSPLTFNLLPFIPNMWLVHLHDISTNKRWLGLGPNPKVCHTHEFSKRFRDCRSWSPCLSSLLLRAFLVLQRPLLLDSLVIHTHITFIRAYWIILIQVIFWLNKCKHVHLFIKDSFANL